MNDHQSPYFPIGSSGPFQPSLLIPKMEVKTEPMDGQGQSATPKVKKKPGRKRKNAAAEDVKQEKITDHMPVKKEKRKIDRFKGMPESEVLKRILPDHLAHDLDILIVGINPGLYAAFVGHHYAGPGNHFWKCMFLSGLIQEQLTAYDDFKLLNCGIGFTNIVERTSRGSADLTRKEIKEGAKILTEKVNKYRPKICVFNGKGIYEVFCGHKNFAFGKQPEPLEGTETTVYVMPSSSARCAQLPRAVDKVPFYVALRKLRDYLRGDIPQLDDSEVCFPDLELKVAKKEPKAEPTEETFNSSCQQTEMLAGGCSGGNVVTDSYMSIKQEQPFIKQEKTYNLHEYGGMSSNYGDYSQSRCSMNSNSSYPQSPCSINSSNSYVDIYNSGANNSQGSQLSTAGPESRHNERLHHFPESSTQLMGVPPSLQEQQIEAAVSSSIQAASQIIQCQSMTNMSGPVAVQCSSRLQQYQYRSASQAMCMQESSAAAAAAAVSSFQTVPGLTQTSATFAASQRFQFSFSQNLNFPSNGQLYNGQSYPQILPGNSGQIWSNNSGHNQSYIPSQSPDMVQVKQEPQDYYDGSGGCPYQSGN